MNGKSFKVGGVANKKEIRQKKREERRIEEWGRNNYSTSAQIMYLAVHYYSYITIFIAESLKFHINNLGCCHRSPKKGCFGIVECTANYILYVACYEKNILKETYA